MVAGCAVVSHSVILGMDRCGVHAVQKYHGTALHWASAGGHVKCVRLLLDRGLDVDVMSDRGAGVNMVGVSSWLAIRPHRVAWALHGVRRAPVDICK
jgi:hypothetical protein